MRVYILLLLLLFKLNIIFVNCENEKKNIENDKNDRKLLRGLDPIDQVSEQDGDEFEGDILTSYEQIAAVYTPQLADELLDQGIVEHEEDNEGERQRQLGLFRSYTRLWDKVDGVVRIPYQVSNEYSANQIAAIEYRLQLFEDKLLYFEFPRVADCAAEDNCVYISQSGGCSSFVGRRGGTQAMSLVPGCLGNLGTT